MTQFQPVVTAVAQVPRRLAKRWFAASSLLLAVTVVTVATDSVLRRSGQGDPQRTR